MHLLILLNHQPSLLLQAKGLSVFGFQQIRSKLHVTIFDQHVENDICSSCVSLELANIAGKSLAVNNL